MYPGWTAKEKAAEKSSAALFSRLPSNQALRGAFNTFC
jgi:hypothetical protein